LDQGTDRVAAGGKSGTSHVPIADVAGGEDHAFAVRVRGVDVFPAVDANVFHQVTRLEVRQSHEIDHVAGVISKCGAGNAPRLTRVGLWSQDLAHIVGRATQMTASEHPQRKWRCPANQPIRDSHGYEAHQEGASYVAPIDHCSHINRRPPFGTRPLRGFVSITANRCLYLLTSCAQLWRAFTVVFLRSWCVFDAPGKQARLNEPDKH